MREYHGGTGTSLYKVWKGMRNRCRNPNDKSFKNYGGRGITVCPEWESFGVFRSWALAAGYREGLEIDREDNDGPYSPDNCRWATRLTNVRNNRHVHYVTAFGETKAISAWADDERCSVSYGTLKKRLRDGCPPEQAITLPLEDRSSEGLARKRGAKRWSALRGA